MRRCSHRFTGISPTSAGSLSLAPAALASFTAVSLALFLPLLQGAPLSAYCRSLKQTYYQLAIRTLRSSWQTWLRTCAAPAYPFQSAIYALALPKR